MKWLYCSDKFSQNCRLNLQSKPTASENGSVEEFSDLKIWRITVVIPYFSYTVCAFPVHVTIPVSTCTQRMDRKQSPSSPKTCQNSSHLQNKPVTLSDNFGRKKTVVNVVI